MRLVDSAWPAIAAVGRSAIVAVPLGSTEQHGPHLPFSTDTEIAVALCEALARTRDDVVVAPAVAYGASGEHAGFPGTLSIGTEALRHLVVELGRSATDTFGHVVFVSAHGGNAEAVTEAAATLRAESRDVLVFCPSWQGDLHAGHVETSILLALRPEAVDLSAAVVGDTRPWQQLGPALRAGGVLAVTETGVLGDPTSASAAAGHALLSSLGSELSASVDAWRTRVPA